MKNYTKLQEVKYVTEPSNLKNGEKINIHVPQDRTIAGKLEIPRSRI